MTPYEHEEAEEQKWHGDEFRNRPIIRVPRCPECGTTLAEVDCEQTYPVLRGDCERREFIPQPWYCEGCLVGVEERELQEQEA